MEMSMSSVLVDGTFRNPIVLASVIVAALVLSGGALLLVRSSFVPARTPALAAGLILPVVTGCVLVSPVAFNATVSLVSHIGSTGNSSLCLMPTFMPVRDFAPGAIAAATAILDFARLLSSKGGRRAH